MAMDVIGRLSVALGMNTAAFEKGSTMAEKRAAQMQRKFQQIGKKMKYVGRDLTIGVTAPLAAIGVASAKAAIDARDAIGQMEASLESMGNGAGRNSEQLQKLAKNLEGISAYDDKEILREVTANMLTFGDVAGENFDRANRAAVNLSAKLDQDLKSSTILIGKALNDPVKGLSALSRVGVKLAPEQEALAKKMASVGDIAGAQNVILRELEKQYEGSAQAVRDAAPGSDTINKWSDMKERIGEFVLLVADRLTPFLDKVITGFMNMSPAMQTTIVVAGALAAALGPVLLVLGPIISAVGTLLPLLAKLGPVLTVIRGAMLLLAANPVVLAFAGTIAGIYLAWKNWDKIEPILRRLYTAAKTWLFDKLGSIMDWVRDKIAKVEAAFAWLYDKVVGNSHIPDMVNEVGEHMRRLDREMVDPAVKAAETVEERMRRMAAETRALIDQLFPDIARLEQFNATKNRIDAFDRPQFYKDKANQSLRNQTFGSIGGIQTDQGSLVDNEKIEKNIDRFNRTVMKMGDKAKEGTVRVAQSFRQMAQDTISSVQNMVSAIKGGGFFDILGGVLDFGLQLASIGAFGKGMASRVNGSVPGYATGTRNHPGGLAWVGERGPELVSMPRGSSVFTNSESRQMMQQRQVVEIVDTTGLFKFRVDKQIGEVAPTIMEGGAQIARARDIFSSSRRLA